MNLVDSSGWIEYLANSRNASFFAPALEDTESLLVSTVNVYEVFKRVFQQRGEDAALQAVALMHQARVVAVTSPLSLDAARLSAELKLPMADSLILATARAYRATVWTQDAHFERLPDAKFIRK